MLRPQPGTYALVCASESKQVIEVGCLGRFEMRRGWYLYVGSAFGPGGILGRVEHHRRIASHPHWHIDYLRLHARLDAVWFTYDRSPREHLWAAVASESMNGSIHRGGFGSSDCQCGSHLFFFRVRPRLRSFTAFAHAAARTHGALHEFRLPAEA
jgi:Uri superfamily endonuclease